MTTTMRSSTNRRMRSITGLAVVALIAATATATAAASATRAPQVRASQQLAVLNNDTEAFNKPAGNSGSAGEVNEVRPISGERTVLPVVGGKTDSHGTQWLQVLLPGRPNSHTGWIHASVVTLAATNWQIVVSLSARKVTVFENGHLVQTFLAVVGAPATPTPTGHFFVEEAIPLAAQLGGAPFALALSARSNALKTFDGGPGQVALHGINNIGGTPGTAVSHGCVRLATSAITWLGLHISSGVPVTINA